MIHRALFFISLVLQATTMGLSPGKPCLHTTPNKKNQFSVAGRNAASAFMAATIFAATTTPLPASAVLTKQDVQEIVQTVVKESEDRMTDRMTAKLKESEDRMTLKLKESEDRMNVKLDDQRNQYILIPTLAAVFSSLKLDDTLARFVLEKETFKRDLAANLSAGTEAKARKGALTGIVLTVILMASGAFSVFLVTSSSASAH